nr:DUF6368 family protein [Streptomyces sp. CB00455]
MRIGIMGAGAMAEALGTGWAKAGHDIVVAARDADKATDLAARLGARAGTFAEAAAHGDAVLAALPHTAMLDVVAPLADTLAGRAVIDCSNPIVPGPGGLMLTTDGGPSAARVIADAAPDAHVIKAFNVCAAEVWARYPDGLAVPLCGEDAGALDLVRALARRSAYGRARSSWPSCCKRSKATRQANSPLDHVATALLTAAVMDVIGGVVNAELRQDQVPIVADLSGIIAMVTDPWPTAYGSAEFLRAWAQQPGFQLLK